MMSVTAWGHLKVDEFFKDYNWLGQQPNLKSTEIVSEEQPSWLCLSVEEFINQNNWQGKQTVKRNPESNANASTLSLLITVDEFFQLARDWRNETKASFVSKPQSKPEPSVSDSQKYNLSDLSDLF